MSNAALRSGWACTALAVLAACYAGRGGAASGGGAADDDDGDGSGGSVDDGGSGDAPPTLDCTLGTQPKLRMLTRAELAASITAAFAIDAATSIGALPAEPEINGYDNSADALVMDDVRLEQLVAVGGEVGAAVVADLAEVLPCSQDAADEACARSFVADKLPALARRPVTDAEIDAVMEVVRVDLEAGDFAAAISAAVTTMVLDPSHLYRSELGDGTRLTGIEIASLLAFELAGGPPDAELLAAADELRDPEVRRAHARRLLATAAGQRRVFEFAWDWLGLDRLGTVARNPEAFDADLRADMRTQFDRFVGSVVFDGDGRIPTLMAAPYTFANDAIGAVYGLDGAGASADAFAQVDAPSRPGLLGQPAFLATYARPETSSPVKRGVALRERVLCQELPPPPPAVNTMLPDAPDLPTTRAKSDAHVSDEACRACHTLIDPAGFGFENFDAIGRWRDQENGVTVDASGALTGTNASDGSFADYAELAGLLAASPDVPRCVVVNFNMTAMGTPTSYDRACAPPELVDAALADDATFVELLVEWAALDATITRVVE